MEKILRPLQNQHIIFHCVLSKKYNISPKVQEDSLSRQIRMAIALFSLQGIQIHIMANLLTFSRDCGAAFKNRQYFGKFQNMTWKYFMSASMFYMRYLFFSQSHNISKNIYSIHGTIYFLGGEVLLYFLAVETRGQCPFLKPEAIRTKPLLIVYTTYFMMLPVTPIFKRDCLNLTIYWCHAQSLQNIQCHPKLYNILISFIIQCTNPSPPHP